MDTADLRGDYSTIADDYTVAQDWDAYRPAEHALWRRLYARQSKIIAGRAAPDYLRHLDSLAAADGLPRLDAVSERLNAATGWQLVAVPGLIPEDVFFAHLAGRRFPVTVWLRRPEEIDYLVEPDIFHDFFGHVPLLFDPVFAGFLERYGHKGPEAVALGGLDCLARLYWYMVEFGLIETSTGLRAYGAGMLSSKGETLFCLTAKEPNRLGFALERVMQTQYRIDAYQRTYFVIDTYETLFNALNADFAPIYARLAQKPPLAAETVLPEDRVLWRGRWARG